MNLGDQTLVAVLVAFALGMAAGRLWTMMARDRRAPARRLSWSIHFIVGLDLLASRKLDLAIEELTKAAREDTEATDIFLVLGNLLREKGQLERAIQIHQSVLHRPGLSRSERAVALLCLGMDFKRAGFRNRALQTLEDVVAIEPTNTYALGTLVKIYEEDQDWERALRIQEQLASATGVSSSRVEAFLHDQIGQRAWGQGDGTAAARAFEASIRSDPRVAPAHIHLGDVLESLGRHEAALAAWSELAKRRPELAHLVFERLARVRLLLGNADETERMYEQAVAADNRDWRARLSLARLRAAAGRREEAFELLLQATGVNPHALPVQLAILELLAERAEDQTDELARYRGALAASAFFLDPHVCVKCNYRTNGILWRCPHCQEWNTFVEERLETPER